MSNVALRLEGLGKRYKIGERSAHYKMLREGFASAAARSFQTMGRLFSRDRAKEGESGRDHDFWALRDLSLDVKHGEIIGIIGRNGAGKSTLLKLLSRITEPTEGRTRIYGRVGSLLEVGTGFHPELTGRENIYFNGVILGMRHSEVEKKFDEIVAFAEIERFLDTPVKRYSSGMQLRLGFSVAAHLEPEILIIDEVLAVGDAAFQKKCLGKMNEVAKGGRTILFVSHNIPAVTNLCTRGIVIDRGRMICDGEVTQSVQKYLDLVEGTTSISLRQRTDRKGNQRIKFVEFSVRDENGHTVNRVFSGQTITLVLRYILPEPQPFSTYLINVDVLGRFEEHLFHLTSETQRLDSPDRLQGGEFLCTIPDLPLNVGRYPLNFYCQIDGEVSDFIRSAASIEVESGDFFQSGKLPPPVLGPFLARHSWRHTLENVSNPDYAVASHGADAPAAEFTN